MARDKELEAERAKTRELERLLRVAEAEFRARPGNENVVLPCCICGQTTHSSADCRRYHFLEREARPPPQRERWVEVADPGSGEKPRLVTAATSGVSKRRPHMAGGRLKGPRVSAKPFKIGLDTVNAIAVVRRIFTPDQLSRPGKAGSLADAAREGAAAGPACILTLRATVGGTLASQPKVAESAGQATGQASTLAAMAHAGEVATCVVTVVPREVDEPGNVEASPLSARVGQTTEAHPGAAKSLPCQARSGVDWSMDADATAECLVSDCPGEANECRTGEAPSRNASGIGAEAAGQTADARSVTSKPLPYHDRACPKGLLGAGATTDAGGGETPAGTAADDSAQTQTTADALTRVPDSPAIQPLSARTGARSRAYPLRRTFVEKSLSGMQGGWRGSRNELFVAPTSGCSSVGLRVEKLRLAGAVNQSARITAKVDEGAAEGDFACTRGENVRRGQAKVTVLMLLVMRVALALGASLTGGRGGSPVTCANTDTEHRKWCINQAEDCHLEAAPD